MTELATELKEQMRVARVAATAYDTYFKQYVESRRASILDMFQNAPNDSDTLTSLKYLVDALNALEASILADVDSGKMASIEMNENRSMN